MIAHLPLPFLAMRSVARRLLSYRSALAAIALLLVIIIPCVAAPAFAPYDPSVQPDIIGLRSQGPTAAHPFGTAPFSRDVLSRVLYGGRVSLAVALVAPPVSITLGTAYGAIAGCAGGAVEAAMMRILAALPAIPRQLPL